VGFQPHETISQTFDGRETIGFMITYGRPYSKDPKSGEVRKNLGRPRPLRQSSWRTRVLDEATIFSRYKKPIVIGETAIPGGRLHLVHPAAGRTARQTPINVKKS